MLLRLRDGQRMIVPWAVLREAATSTDALLNTLRAARPGGIADTKGTQADTIPTPAQGLSQTGPLPARGCDGERCNSVA